MQALRLPDKKEVDEFQRGVHQTAGDAKDHGIIALFKKESIHRQSASE